MFTLLAAPYTALHLSCRWPPMSCVQLATWQQSTHAGVRCAGVARVCTFARQALLHSASTNRDPVTIVEQ